ncbi:small GTPase superfamily, Ras type [Kipferlia bialata]|uniref:Small GTPase superfamily, Ras type n=1 Tax=Kipferlia bialata TaxID=797122 RepID=A0A9K3GGI2_9EUKA|nr:small GTPase superfamily, Ras type [Kipferlia bialata]|eukprot:g2253.t1
MSPLLHVGGVWELDCALLLHGHVLHVLHRGRGEVGGQAGVGDLGIRGQCVFILNLWDTAGQERFKSLTQLYFRGAKIAVLVCDVTEAASFGANLTFWYDALRAATDECAVILAVNKYDLIEGRPGMRDIDETAIEAFCQERNISWFYTSAKSGLNVNELFEGAVEKYLDTYRPDLWNGKARSLPSQVPGGVNLSAQQSGGGCPC